MAAQRAQRLAETERDAAVNVLERRPAPPDIEVDVRTPDEMAGSDDASAGAEAQEEAAEPRPAKPRLLNVAATLGHLLPDNMDGLLVPGAQVMRREGRLAALLAITGSPSTENADREEEQAELLRAKGFRVEWLEGDRLAS
ncbi:MAG: hypothetical protein ACRDZ7_08160 [Acidimicrobiia bacterium]